MNNVKKYKKEIKKQFGKLSVDEKEMLSTFFNHIYEDPDVETLSYNELVEKFGEPSTIYSTYINNSDESILISKQFNKRKNFMKLSIVIITIIVISLVVTIIHLKNEAEKSFINREEVETIIEK